MAGSEERMNPRKATMLANMDKIAHAHDESIKRDIDIVMNPSKHGWEKSLLTGAVVIPITGVSAMLIDFSRVLLARSDDKAWDRQPPEES
jgi:hypothetical protein